MAIPLGIQYPGAWYHIINRGERDKKVYEDDFDRRRFLQLLGEYVEMWNIEIHAYSLINTHYHLLICTPEANISRAMRHIDGVYTQRFPSDAQTFIPGASNEARNIAVYLTRKLGGYKLNEIARIFDFGSYSGVNSVLTRVDKRLLKDDKLAESIKKVKKHIQPFIQK